MDSIDAPTPHPAWESLAGEGSAHALKHFTDRKAEIRRFVERLHVPEGRVLFWHADGGSGKSLLLAFLQAHGCKWLSEWEYLQSKHPGDADFVEEFLAAETQGRIATASIDFGARPEAFDPRNDLDGLLTLRESLIKSGIRLHQFDYALTELDERTAVKGPLRRSFGEHGLSAAMAVGSTIIAGSNPAAAIGAVPAVFSWVKKLAGLPAHRALLKSHIPAETASLVDSQDTPTLRAWLPVYFAADLGEALRSDRGLKRIVLFFDTHEGFWAHQTEVSDEQFFARDQWVRILLRELLDERGVLCVLAGRDRPRWARAPRLCLSDRRATSIPEERVEVRLVNGLSPADAGAYLDSVEEEFWTTRSPRPGRPPVLFTPDIRGVLIRICTETADQIHPFYLALCVDAIAAAYDDGRDLGAGNLEGELEAQDSRRDLMLKLLKYVPPARRYAIRALSVARSFDFAVYRHLAASLYFEPHRPEFDLLCRFSFVRHSGGRFQVHDLLRRCFALSQDPEDRESVAAAHACLKEYFRAIAENAVDAEASAGYVYHTWMLDPEAGAEEWIGLFDRADAWDSSGTTQMLVSLLSELPPAPTPQAFSINVRVAAFHDNWGRPLTAVEFHDKCLATLEAWRSEPESASRYLFAEDRRGLPGEAGATVSPVSAEAALNYIAVWQGRVMLDKANSLSGAADADVVDRVFASALDLLPEAGEEQARLDAMRNLLRSNRAYALFEAGYSLRALHGFQEAREALESGRATPLLAISEVPGHLATGEAYRLVGLADAALYYFARAAAALACWQESGGETERVDATGFAAQLYVLKGTAAIEEEDLGLAERCFSAVKTMTGGFLEGSNGDVDVRIALVRALVGLAVTHQRQGRTEEARTEAEAAVARIADVRLLAPGGIESSADWAKCVLRHAEILFQTGGQPAALTLLEGAVEELGASCRKYPRMVALRAALIDGKILHAFLKARSGDIRGIEGLLALQEEAQQACEQFPEYLPLQELQAGIWIRLLQLQPSAGVDALVDAVLSLLNPIFQQGVYHQRLLWSLAGALLEAGSGLRNLDNLDGACACYSYVIQILGQVAGMWPLVPKLQMRRAAAGLELGRILALQGSPEAAAAFETCISSARAIGNADHFRERANALIADAQAALEATGNPGAASASAGC